jgi:multiple sugar transport system ATP-binding protein
VAAITLDAITKRFGDTCAVRDVSLQVPSGAFLSLVGPSGCGKTTLLRMLAGLETPTEGEIRFDGEAVDRLPPGRRDIAMVFQSYALYPQMTVAQNLAYPLRKRGVPTAERAARVAEVAAMLELEPLLQRKPRQLSGGQQQRVALGRALIREPRVFLLDEPLSNLDATLRTHMRREIGDLHRRLARTMVYVTHDQLEAMTMSTHIAVLDRGELQQIGSPDDVYHRPANRTVASFIGSPAMAFLEGEVAEVGGMPVLRLAGHVVAELSAMPADRRLTVGIRPEDVRVAADGIPARVIGVENAGHEAIARLEIAAGAIAARLPAGRAPRAGDTLSILPAADRLHPFDLSTGARLALDPRPPSIAVAPSARGQVEA